MTERKTPQDHKPTAKQAAKQKQLRLEDIDGADLLIPFTKVKGSDQLRLMAKLRGLGVTEMDEDADVVDMPLEDLADFIDWVADRFAVDTGRFEEFTTGPGGFERALNLAIAYSGALGESDGSES